MGKNSVILKPDNRGRVLLPKEWRTFPLLELVEQSSSLTLYPLQVNRPLTEKSNTHAYWTLEEQKEFLTKSFFPKLATLCQKQMLVSCKAAVLYGSYARESALNTSDFDLAIFCEKRPSFQIRTDFHDELYKSLVSEFEILKSHGIRGELSFVFIPFHSFSTIPALYYSIAKDGTILWETENTWTDWLKKMIKIMKEKNVQWEGKGRNRKWMWKT